MLWIITLNTLYLINEIYIWFYESTSNIRIYIMFTICIDTWYSLNFHVLQEERNNLYASTYNCKFGAPISALSFKDDKYHAKATLPKVVDSYEISIKIIPFHTVKVRRHTYIKYYNNSIFFGNNNLTLNLSNDLI